MGLNEYKRNRHFSETPEPQGRGQKARRSRLCFVVQKHAAAPRITGGRRSAPRRAAVKKSTNKTKLPASKAKTKKQTRKQVKISPGSLPGAKRGEQPTQFQPQVAKLVRQIPETDDWLHELKFDGYRLICILKKGRSRLLTRRGKDWTHRFPSVADAATQLGIQNGILDGEVVVLDARGISNFQDLQNVLQREGDQDVVWYVFDLPYCEGYDLTQTTLAERKSLLQSLLPNSDDSIIRFSDHIVGHGP